MKRLKKIWSVILCLAFIFSVASCELVDKVRGIEYVSDYPADYSDDYWNRKQS